MCVIFFTNNNINYICSFCSLFSVGGDVGDLVSPGMFEDYLTTLNTAWIYPGSGEGYVFEFDINLQTLNYLQTINLLDEKKLEVTLEFMQTSIICSCFACFFRTERQSARMSKITNDGLTRSGTG